MEKQQRTRLATALILALVFGTGVVLGVAVDRRAIAGAPAEGGEMAASDEGRDDDDDRDRDRRQPIYEQVGTLEPDQRDRIEVVVEEYRASGRELWQEWREEYEPLERERKAWEEEHVEPLRREWEGRRDSLVEATRTRIKEVMTSEQARRYDSLVADYEQRRDDRRRGRDDSGGGRR